MERAAETARVVGELESVVRDLTAQTAERWREWVVARLGDFYEGGLKAFGLAGPDHHELLDAALWFMLDCPLDEGPTPLARLRPSGRAGELLSRSELRVWRIESIGGAGLVSVLSPLDGSSARIETVRAPWGELRPGALLVGRSVPLGPERWCVLGGGCAVHPDAHAEFEALLSSLEAPLGEFWNVHGGVLARAAWGWPEDREITIDGQVVENSIASYRIPDLDLAYTTLAADRELAGDTPCDDGATIHWHWRWQPPAATPPAPRPGTRYELCPEDVDPIPYLADVELCIDEQELWLFAPTPGRLALAEQLLRHRHGNILGAVMARKVEMLEIVPRWRRRRWESSIERVEVIMRRSRRRAA